MADFMSRYGMIVILGAFLVLMMMWSSRSQKKRIAQAQEREERLAKEMVQGVWVQTTSGFWGRYVDTDGEVMILETVDGHETYWDKNAIRDIGEPPFATDDAVAASTATDPIVKEEPETVLGLDLPTSSDEGSSETTSSSDDDVDGPALFSTEDDTDK